MHCRSKSRGQVCSIFTLRWACNGKRGLADRALVNFSNSSVTCIMIAHQPGVSVGPQRLATLTNVRTDSRAAFRFHRTGPTSNKRRRAKSQPAPYQWAPLTDGVKENEALERKDFAKFVQFFRQASPYIEGHRERTFVVVIPGEVCTFNAQLSASFRILACLAHLTS